MAVVVGVELGSAVAVGAGVADAAAGGCAHCALCSKPGHSRKAPAMMAMPSPAESASKSRSEAIAIRARNQKTRGFNIG